MPSRIVLIADPAPEVRSFVKSALRSPEYRVFEARGGLEALCVCACHPVDLLLLAVDLPGIDGVRLAQKLSHRFPTLRVLYLSDAPAPEASRTPSPGRCARRSSGSASGRRSNWLPYGRVGHRRDGHGAVHQKSA